MVLANASETESVERPGHAESERRHSTKVLMLGALGVVYGDIGTSPICALPRGAACLVELGRLATMCWACCR
ncbi:hypothetical protein ACVOMV_11260 [Mesorhizobium atlanticum]